MEEEEFSLKLTGRKVEIVTKTIRVTNVQGMILDLEYLPLIAISPLY